MNVTPTWRNGQGRAPARALSVVPIIVTALLTMFAVSAGAQSASDTVTNFEAVDDNGVSTWNGPFPFVLTGVVLCGPSEMLDSTTNYLPWDDGANAYNLGGEWQIFVQAVTPGDRGGVECWLAQCYGNLPWEPHDGSDSYTDEQWTNEVYRVSHDPATGHAFQRGDLVTVTANGALFYGGMENINEEHSTDPQYEFTISLVTSNYGLPEPQVIPISAVIGTTLSPTGHYDIFDPTRQSGGEFYQGMRVRVDGMTLLTTNGWNTNSDWSSRYCTAVDAQGRQFPLIHPLYDLGPAPTNVFNAMGVFMQESGSSTDGTFGYELFVQEIFTNIAVLTIGNQGGSPVISWPSVLTHYQLQASDSLANPNWTTLTNVPVVVNSNNTVSVSAGASQQFYRLMYVP